MLRSIGEQSGKSVQSVPKKNRKATVGRICRTGRFKPGMRKGGVIDDDGIDKIIVK